MKKKLICTLLLIATINFNVYAKDVNTKESVVNKIEYSSIDKLILERNTTVKTNENAIDKLHVNSTKIEDARDDIEDSIDHTKDLVKKMKSEPSPYVKQNIDKPGEDAKPMDDVIYGINKSLNEILDSLEAERKKGIDTLQNSIDSMEDQLEDIKYQEIDMHKLIEKMKIQTEMVNNQMIWTGESLIFAYNSIEIEKKNVDRNLDLVQNQLKTLNVKKDLGLIAEIDMKSVELSIDNLNYTKNNLNTQQENIKAQLNLLLAQPYDTELNIEFTPELNYSKIDSINVEDDLKNSLNKSYTLKIQEYELEAKENALERSYDEDDEDDKREEEYILAMEDLEDEKLKSQDTKRQYESSFKNLYEEVKEKKEAFNIEDKKLEHEKNKLRSSDLRYNLGLISKIEYDDAKKSYNDQDGKVESAKADLFKTYKKYEWMLNGLSIK